MATTVVRPENITKAERAALRAARRERGRRLQQHNSQVTDGATPSKASATSASSGSFFNSPTASRWVWYAGVGIPTALLVWGIRDPDSPPAQFSEMIGLSGWVSSFTDEINKPAHEKLLPDWSQV